MQFFLEFASWELPLCAMPDPSSRAKRAASLKKEMDDMDAFFAQRQRTQHKRASQLQQVKDEDADKWDAPSPATDPPSPAIERDAALHALEEALPTEEMGEVEGVKVEPDAQLAENALEEFWANAPDGSGQHPMEEMEEWCAYRDAAEFADGEDAELGFGAEEEEVPVEEDAPDSDEVAIEDLLEEALDDATNQLLARTREVASSSSALRPGAEPFQPRKWHWSRHKGPAKDLDEKERLSMAVECATRPTDNPHKGPAPSDASQPGFYRGQKWRHKRERWGNSGGYQKRMGRDFAKEAREGKLRSKISKLQQARMEEQAKAIQATSPAERMDLAKKNVPPPPPPPAR